MDAPLSGKQKRENMKFLLNELRDTASFKNDQKRKDQASQQQMRLKEEKAKGVPPIMGKPTNPEAGPKDTIPALLSPGEAVIPAKAAQKPENKPLIKAMVREGRSDKNLSVPMPKGFMCGTEKVRGYELGTAEVEALRNTLEEQNIDTQGWSYNEQGAISPEGQFVPYTTAKQDLLNAQSQYVPLMDPLEIEKVGTALDQARLDVSTLENQNKGLRGRGNTAEFNNKLEEAKDTRNSLQNYYQKEMEWVDAGIPAKPMITSLATKPTEKAVPALGQAQQGAVENTEAFNKDYTNSMDQASDKLIPEPAPLTSVSQIKNEIPVDIPMPTKDDEGNVMPAVEDKIPKDPSGFAKWSNTIGGAIKGAYEGISDPEKLKGALSSTLETLGFNGRDASRFALLVASSKALGYDTTQAVRFAGQYTLKASDQRAQTEAAVDASREKSMIAKGYVKNNKGEWIAPVRTTGSKTMTMSSGSGAGAPITMYERTDVNGTKVLVDSEGRTQDQLEKLYKAPLVTYGESTSKSGIASRWSSWEKDSTDNVKGIYNRDIKPAKKGEVSAVRQMLPADTSVANQVGLKLQQLGYSIDDADVRRNANDILTKTTEQMIADAKAGNQIRTVDHYVERNVLMYKTGINQDLFKFNKNKNETAANMITGQYNQVKNQIMQENPKLNAQKLEDESQKRYQQFRDEWLGNKTESTKDLTTKQREAAAEGLRKQYLESDNASGFFNYVKARLGSQ